MTVRIAVLASGGGSNLQSIIDHFRALATAPAEVSLVLSNRESAPALARAREAGIPTDLVPSDDGSGLLGQLERASIDLVVLAGYLKRIPTPVTTAFRGRIVNIHPALLPRFGGHGMYGARVHEAVLASGARETGLTVHLVDDEYDHGPVVAQWRVPVAQTDTAETLGSRVLAAEHIVYPRIVEMIAALHSAGLSPAS